MAKQPSTKPTPTLPPNLPKPTPSPVRHEKSDNEIPNVIIKSK